MPSQVLYKVTVKTMGWVQGPPTPPGHPGPMQLKPSNVDVYNNISKFEFLAQSNPPMLILKDRNNMVRLIRPLDASTVVEAENYEVPVILAPETVADIMPVNNKVH